MSTDEERARPVPSTARVDGPSRDRAAGWWGLTFVVLLLLSAGMASVPGGSDPLSTVRDFYTAHTGVIVVAQVVGLLAAAAFVPFVLTLRRGTPARTARPDVEASGAVVALAAVLTAVPVLWLTVVADTGMAGTVHVLAVLSDLTDVALFTAIALWCATLVRASDRLPFRVLAGVVAVLSVARAVLLLVRSSVLGMVAPMAFILLVVVLSALVLLRRTPLVRG
jgi:hypothetical protein